MDECNGFIVQNTSEKSPQSQKIIQKRKSAIFQRRSLAPPIIDSNCTTNFNDGMKQLCDVECTKDNEIEEAFNLQEYIQSLKQERKLWQEKLSSRKRQRKDLTKQKDNILRSGQDLDLNVLSESERSFLLARPNYEHICSNGIKLSDVTDKVVMLNKCVHRLNNIFIQMMEDKVKDVTITIIRETD
ncbi:uncharacterized protein LOC107268571 [Cephus cinctus]|uniref:Uncharacterized protein LOC107268571 n=1 Tax=Cephus cinctus TaxID=211228 RepID=A0AAJ7BXS8_CEPCN|nr:uncharacterized protein LOC107268571 [Cephus cinctus]